MLPRPELTECACLPSWRHCAIEVWINNWCPKNGGDTFWPPAFTRNQYVIAAISPIWLSIERGETCAQAIAANKQKNMEKRDDYTILAYDRYKSRLYLCLESKFRVRPFSPQVSRPAGRNEQVHSLKPRAIIEVQLILAPSLSTMLPILIWTKRVWHSRGLNEPKT